MSIVWFRVERVPASGIGLLLVLGATVACVSSGTGTEPEVADLEPKALIGMATPEEILAWEPDWNVDLVGARPDEAAALRLVAARPEIEVEVFFGSWCSDSRRELTRLWRALEVAGRDPGFPIRYIGVERGMQEPEALVHGRDILYVPTFIVSKAGTEVGRIVESAPSGVEVDLADLVEGVASGLLTGRDDLGPPSGAGDSG